MFGIAEAVGCIVELVEALERIIPDPVRDLLGPFLFSGADANKQLSEISGGEQRRLSLAILVCSGANLLILTDRGISATQAGIPALLATELATE